MKRDGRTQHSVNSADTSSASQPTHTQPAFTLRTAVLLQVAPYRFPFVDIYVRKSTGVNSETGERRRRSDDCVLVFTSQQQDEEKKPLQRTNREDEILD